MAFASFGFGIGFAATLIARAAISDGEWVHENSKQFVDRFGFELFIQMEKFIRCMICFRQDERKLSRATC
jgi:hypothetical protein